MYTTPLKQLKLAKASSERSLWTLSSEPQVIFRCHDSGPAGKSLLGVCAASAGPSSAPSLHQPRPGCWDGRAHPASLPHRLLDRFWDFSGLRRFPGGEWRAGPRAWTLCLYGWVLCFCRLSSFWSWLFAGSSLSSFCSWSCSFWEGSVFLIVLIRNLLFVPTRGHFILGEETTTNQTLTPKLNPPIVASTKELLPQSRLSEFV